MIKYLPNGKVDRREWCGTDVRLARFGDARVITLLNDLADALDAANTKMREQEQDLHYANTEPRRSRLIFPANAGGMGYGE